MDFFINHRLKYSQWLFYKNSNILQCMHVCKYLICKTNDIHGDHFGTIS